MTTLTIDLLAEDVNADPYPHFAALREHFEPRAIVELTATIGAYNMVSRFLEAIAQGILDIARYNTADDIEVLDTEVEPATAHAVPAE